MGNLSNLTHTLEFFHDTERVTFDAKVLLSQVMPDLFSLAIPYVLPLTEN